MATKHFGPCMCGDTNCPSCGPLQGYGPDEPDQDQDAQDAPRPGTWRDRMLAAYGPRFRPARPPARPPVEVSHLVIRIAADVPVIDFVRGLTAAGLRLSSRPDGSLLIHKREDRR